MDHVRSVSVVEAKLTELGSQCCPVEAEEFGGGRAVAAGVGQGGEAGPGDARGMLREQLREQVKQNAGNPQMKAMLEKVLRDLD